MSYGVEIYDSSGNVKLSSEDQTIRMVYSFSVPMPSSGTEVVQSFDKTRGFISLSFSILAAEETTFSFNNSTKTLTYDVSEGRLSSNGFAVFTFYNVV